MKRRVLLSGAVALITVAAAAVATAAGAAVPPTPSGWTLVWSDDFTGAANTLPSSGNWIIDTGTSYPGGPANWGTGEIQTYTNSTANVRQDGAGNLRITPIRNGSGQLDLGPHRDHRAPTSRRRPAACCASRAASRCPTSPARRRSATGPRSGRSARRTAATTGTGRASASSTSWRTSTASTRSGACSTVESRRAARATRSTASAPTGPARARPASRRSTRTASSGTQRRARSSCAGTSTASSYHTVSAVPGRRPHWSNMTSHAGYFILLNVAMGGAFPNGVAGTGTPTAATASGVPMLVDYVAVYTRGGGTTPPTTPPPTPPPPTGGGGRRVRARSRPRRTTRSPACSTEACSEGGQNIGWLAQRRLGALRQRQLRLDAGARLRGPGRLRGGRRRQRPGRGAPRQRQQRRRSAPSRSPTRAAGRPGARCPATSSAVTGTHTVFLTFTSGQPADFVNVNWFHFRN